MLVSEASSASAESKRLLTDVSGLISEADPCLMVPWETTHLEKTVIVLVKSTNLKRSILDHHLCDHGIRGWGVMKDKTKFYLKKEFVFSVLLVERENENQDRLLKYGNFCAYFQSQLIKVFLPPIKEMLDDSLFFVIEVAGCMV